MQFIKKFSELNPQLFDFNIEINEVNKTFHHNLSVEQVNENKNNFLKFVFKIIVPVFNSSDKEFFRHHYTNILSIVNRFKSENFKFKIDEESDANELLINILNILNIETCNSITDVFTNCINEPEFDFNNSTEKLISPKRNNTNYFILNIVRQGYNEITNSRERLENIRSEINLYNITFNGKRFSLKAFVVYLENGITNGHYVIYVNYNNNWYLYNDAFVKICNIEEVKLELHNNSTIIYYQKSLIRNKLSSKTKLKSTI